jgi:DNA-binding CsgD family transcriptional regulator
VLDLAAEGLPDKLIAQRLSIQVQTVKNHMQKILRKFGVHGRREAAARLRRSSRHSQNH